MNEELLAAVRAVDTPTIINAIEVAQGSRDFDGFTRHPVHPTETCCQAFVGRALTARIRASAPPSEEVEVTNARRNRYYRYLEQAAEDEQSIIVIEDLDHPYCIGAWWGEINAAIHKALGLAGAITNGLVRDLDFLAPEFPILSGAVGVSHAYVHVVDFGQPVQVFGLKIAPGDLIHADRHGATVIPDHLMLQLPEAIARLQEAEEIILSEVRRNKRLDVDALAASWAAYRKMIISAPGDSRTT